tara:strand:- start:4995 stop:6089 length:1095 start_codon:yes stop_codon:yes gene_type:complete
MRENKPFILITAGGSGGHLFSAQAVASVLKKRNYKIILITDKRVKKLLSNFPADKIKIITSDTFTNKDLIKWPIVALKIFFALIVSLFWVIRTNPVLGIGFGGYPSLPPLLATKLLGHKVIIHEQNTVFGRANTFLSFLADGISSGFKKIKFKSNKRINNISFLGNPVRDEIFKYKNKNNILDKKNIRLLIFGGSQGSSFLNDIIKETLKYFPKKILKDLYITHQTRDEDISSVRNFYKIKEIRHDVSNFFYNLPELIAQSDIVLSRAGASTLSELAIIGKPCILIPLSNTLDGDQENNALNLAVSKAAIVYKELNLDPRKLAKEIIELINNDGKREKLAKNIKYFGDPTASKNIADFAEKIIG